MKNTLRQMSAEFLTNPVSGKGIIKANARKYVNIIEMNSEGKQLLTDVVSNVSQTYFRKHAEHYCKGLFWNTLYNNDNFQFKTEGFLILQLVKQCDKDTLLSVEVQNAANKQRMTMDSRYINETFLAWTFQAVQLAHSVYIVSNGGPVICSCW